MNSHPSSSPASLLPTASLDLRIRLTRYEGSLPQESWLQAVSTGGADATFQPDFAGARWRVGLSTNPTEGPQADGGVDFRLTAAVQHGSARQVAFGLEFHATAWSRENFLVMPGGVYDGNRFLSRKTDYPPVAAANGIVGPDVPVVINDIPRLSTEDGAPSRLQQLSSDMATPAVGFFDPVRQTGVWILTPSHTRLGLTGFDVEESPGRDRATLRITAPGVREGKTYHGMKTERPSPDRAADWGTHEAAALSVRVFVFPCSSRLELLRRFTGIRAAFHPPAPPRALLPLSAARDLIEEKYNRDNWNEALGFHASDSIREGGQPSWQAGWIGGGIVNYPLLAQGTPETAARSRRGLDFICKEAVSPSGFFRSLYQDGKWADDSFGHSRNGEVWHMTRKSADLLLFLVKQIQWQRTHHAEVGAPAAWNRAARGCADAFVRLWRREGQIGQFVDENTGALLVGQSDSAAILPAALALAAEAFNDDSLRQVARETGEDFWQRFKRQGFTTGGPGEILSAPDSESAFGLLESFVTLWETTGERVWLVRAEAAADYCATWCVSYDFAFPPGSTFGALQMSSTGTVIANAQNKHSSPGICTLSGDSLFRLFRATGRRFHLDLVREIATSLPQFVSRSDRPITARQQAKDMPPGWICERVNLSDWLEPVGEIFHGSCWSEVSLLLTALELPTIYFRPDTGLLVSLDHIEARISARSEDLWTLEITNPTAFPAQVRLLTENAEAAARPLATGTCAALPAVAVAAGQTVRTQLPRLGPVGKSRLVPQAQSR